MAKKSQITGKEPLVYPDKTEGSEIAEENRSEANKLSEEQREELFQKGMQVIYGGTGEAVRARH